MITGTTIDAAVSEKRRALVEKGCQIERVSAERYSFVSPGYEQSFVIHHQAVASFGSLGPFLLFRLKDNRDGKTSLKESSFLGTDPLHIMAFASGKTQYYDEKLAASDVQSILDRIPQDEKPHSKSVADGLFSGGKYDFYSVGLFRKRALADFSYREDRRKCFCLSIGSRMTAEYATLLAMLRLIAGAAMELAVGATSYIDPMMREGGALNA